LTDGRRWFIVARNIINRDGKLRNVVIILRVHIILIGMMGALMFGWLLTDRYLVGVALLAGIDWLLVNLLNRVSDQAEDRANDIPGAESIRGARWPVAGYVAILFVSMAATAWWAPALIGWRLFMQATGLLYNFKMIPWRGGHTRLKEVYFLKNFMSALGFVTTCFAYPLAFHGAAPWLGWAAVGALIAYFIPFELTYEILYDLRDVHGDREHGIPTYPVVHGPDTTRRIINGLLALSVTTAVTAFFAGWIGARELLLAGGPVVQFFVMRPMLRRGPTIGDCIWITNLGWMLLAFFLMGAAVWRALGLPANIYF
jgi:4-hydroxybenzoate polyprenyltransferase